MKSLLLKLIRFYQRTFSPDHGAWGRLAFGGACRFQPTCSEYTYQAVEKYGAGRGLRLGLKRILRCHPFAKGGFDPVPNLGEVRGDKIIKS
jgi:putative membrane protein insertion efficiency factor